MQTALKASKLQHKLLPAENKMALDGRRIIYLSKYCDEERPTILGNYDITTELQALAEVGFIDIVGWTNLRMISDRVYVFDTEKASFAENVREKIDSFGSCHDAIRAILEEKLKG